MPEYTVKAKTLFPVHIGGGPEHLLDPLAYVVKNDMFFRVKIEVMLTSDKVFAEDFIRFVDKNDIIGLRKILSDQFDPSNSDLFSGVASVSPAFKEEYDALFSDKNNQILVQCMPTTPAGQVYIPGSSIKGAIRTAVLDYRAQNEKKGGYKGIAEKAKIGDPKYFYQRCEQSILDMSNPSDDPFKALKISDALIPKGMTRILQVQNCGKDGKSLGISMFVEAVMNDIEFIFSLQINDKSSNGKVRSPLKLNEILDATTQFYQNALKDEEERFYDGNAAARQKVDLVFDKIADNETVLRIGRFSHIESMTFNAPGILRIPRPPKDRKTGIPKSWGTTRNLSDGKIPLGMIKLSFEKIS